MRIEELNEVEKDVRAKCSEIKAKVDEVRTIIAQHLCSPANLHGCLNGTEDDYLEQIDS